jgi:arylsulfatase A-like enzyme
VAFLQVGDTYPTADRQRYAAMTNFIDTAVGNVTDALRARGAKNGILF